MKKKILLKKVDFSLLSFTWTFRTSSTWPKVKKWITCNARTDWAIWLILVLSFLNILLQSWAVLHGYLFGISSTCIWSTEYLKYFKKFYISSTSVFQVPVFPVLPVLFFLVFKKKGLSSINIIKHLRKKILCIFLQSSA